MCDFCRTRPMNGASGRMPAAGQCTSAGGMGNDGKQWGRNGNFAWDIYIYTYNMYISVYIYMYIYMTNNKIFGFA
jgi:hypothetical protein